MHLQRGEKKSAFKRLRLVVFICCPDIYSVQLERRKGIDGYFHLFYIIATVNTYQADIKGENGEEFAAKVPQEGNLRLRVALHAGGCVA